MDKANAYLCLAYDETDTEPVNAVGSDTGATSQFNMTREGYRLYFSAQPPEYRGLLETVGRENVQHPVRGQRPDAWCSLRTAAVCGGDEFTVGMLVVKNEKTPPVQFTLEGECGIVDSEDGRISLSYTESPEESRNVLTTTFRVKAQGLTDMVAPLFPNGAELTIEMGGHTYKNMLEIPAEIALCADRAAYLDLKHQKDDLSQHLQGPGDPYLPGQAGADPVHGPGIPGACDQPAL